MVQPDSALILLICISKQPAEPHPKQQLPLFRLHHSWVQLIELAQRRNRKKAEKQPMKQPFAYSWNLRICYQQQAAELASNERKMMPTEREMLLTERKMQLTERKMMPTERKMMLMMQMKLLMTPGMPTVHCPAPHPPDADKHSFRLFQARPRRLRLPTIVST